MNKFTNKKFVHFFKIIITASLLFGYSVIQAQSIPIKMDRNVTLIPVEIGECGPLKILLDTGMTFDGLLIYNPDLCDSIKLENPIEVRVPGAGGGEPSTGFMDTSAIFFIGNMTFTNQRVILLQSDTYKGFPSDGIIGYSILGNYITEIDYDNEKIILHDSAKFNPDESWKTIPIYFKNNQIPWIDVSIAIENEKPFKISTYIDLASGDAIELLERENMKFDLPQVTEEAYLGRGLSGDIYGKIGKISELIIGGYKLNNIVASFAPAEIRSKQENADGILGNDALRRFNLIFDYNNKLLYLKPNKYFFHKFE